MRLCNSFHLRKGSKRKIIVNFFCQAGWIERNRKQKSENRSRRGGQRSQHTCMRTIIVGNMLPNRITHRTLCTLASLKRGQALRSGTKMRILSKEALISGNSSRLLTDNSLLQLDPPLLDTLGTLEPPLFKHGVLQLSRHSSRAVSTNASFANASPEEQKP